MARIDKIKEPICNELKEFDNYFNRIMKTNVPLLNLVLKYILRRKGKQMRPMLVFLTAKLLGKPNESTYTVAALIEILHTATLIHDDVVDESNERRGFFSINAIWKSKVAVLVGDYLLAKGLLLAVHHKEYAVLNLVSDAVKEMIEGELQQIRNSRKLMVSEEDYFEIIRKKTATLISCCSSCGAISVGASDALIQKMHHFGELVGIAFQIKDDLLDYQINSITGKPSGNDIQEKKITLPLIHALQIAENHDKKKIIKLMNNASHRQSHKFNEVLTFIQRHDGIHYAETKMKEYAALALKEIDSFENSAILEALRDFISYTIERQR